MSTIAIDLGASFVKVAKFKNDEIVKVIEQPSPSADKDEYRIEKVYHIIESILLQLVEDDEEINIAFSTEMHGFILADDNGKPITDYISWQDERANNGYRDNMSYLEVLSKILDPDEIKKTGMPIKAGLPSVNLFCFLLSNKLDNQRVFFYTLGDYIIRRLTGKSPYIHITNAAATGLYDLVSGEWHRYIIDAIGASSIIFPVVSDGKAVILGEINGVTCRLFPPIGDQQAALLGANFMDLDSLSVNHGTGAQLSLIVDQLDFSDDYQIRPYFNGHYIKTVPHIPSGRALNVYIRFLCEIANEFTSVTDQDIWEYVMKEVAKIHNATGNHTFMDIDLSFFTNAITKNVYGSISNIGEYGLTVGNLFYSTFQQIATNAYSVAGRIGAENVKTIYFCGGIVRKNAILRELIVDKFNSVNQVFVAENETLKGIWSYVEMNS